MCACVCILACVRVCVRACVCVLRGEGDDATLGLEKRGTVVTGVGRAVSRCKEGLHLSPSPSPPPPLLCGILKHILLPCSSHPPPFPPHPQTLLTFIPRLPAAPPCSSASRLRPSKGSNEFGDTPVVLLTTPRSPFPASPRCPVHAQCNRRVRASPLSPIPSQVPSESAGHRAVGNSTAACEFRTRVPSLARNRHGYSSPR